MQFPIDRRTAFGGMAGAALAYGVSSASRGQEPGSAGPARPALTPADRVAAKLGERPSVKDKGAKGDGIAMDGAAIQDALEAFDTVWVPPGVYMIDVPLVVPSYRVLTFSSDAIFCPAHDGMTIFTTKEVSYASRILAPRIHARGKRNVTAFDMTGFRHRAEIQHPDIMECFQGIVLRSLCWDTLIHMPWIRQTGHPLIVLEGSNAVDVVHPGIDGFETGIRIASNTRQPTTSVRIWGGYVQNGRNGLVDEGGIGTSIDGTYFEGLRDADIVLNKSIRTNLTHTQHYGGSGQAAIRMRGADGATIFDPVMSSGTRTTGLYDIDDACRNVTRFEVTTGGGMNQPLGRIGASAVLGRQEQGQFVPTLGPSSGNVAYRRQQGRWSRTGGQITVAVELGWTRAAAGGELIVVGLGAVLGPVLGATSLVAATSLAIIESSNGGQGVARLAPDGTLRIMAIERGALRAWPTPTDGWLTLTLSCLL